VWNAGPDAVEVFDDAGQSVRVDPVNGELLISPQWIDPVAVAWAIALIERDWAER
jgi:hypothetical protein